ncbi:MAG: TrkH family potassium uptake protein [Puniceicoccaceae bacterium]
MHFPILFRLLSSIIWVLTASFALCLTVALHFGHDLTAAVRGFGISIAISITLGTLLRVLGRGAHPRLFRKEALCLIGIGWLLASLLGALPYLLILPDCHPVDALFESVSGFTTTGATVMIDYEHLLPPSLLFWRSLSQWIGGLGVVVLFVAIVSNLGAGAKVLFSNESSGQSADIDDSSINQGAKRIMLYYLALSALCFASYWIAGLSWFDALCHMATTVSTGGFSTINAGVPGFENPALEWCMIVFMFWGGFSFLLVLKYLRNGWQAHKHGLEGRVYTLIVISATLLIMVLTPASPDSAGLQERLRDAAFQVITILTTTGYATENFALWNAPAKWILLLLMVIGGCSSSTAGGVKVIRVIAAFRIAAQSIEKTFRVHVVRPLRLNGRVLDDGARDALTCFLILTGLVLFAGILGFSLLEPDLDIETGLSAVFACQFNIGPGLGAVGPMETFAFLHAPTKLGLCLLMLLGRLEIYALLVLFSPSIWRKFS